MHRQKNRIEIKQPALQEIKKTRSCLKRSCMSGCGCITIVILAIFTFIWLMSNPSPKKLDKIPSAYPKDIPVYDKDSLTDITYLSGKTKNRNVELLAFVPKVFLSPILLGFDKYTSIEENSGNRINLDNLRRVINEPITEQSDSLTVSWQEMTAEPNFILSFYKKELENIQYKTTFGDSRTVLFFKKDNILGSLAITDDPTKDGTDFMIMRLEIDN